MIRYIKRYAAVVILLAVLTGISAIVVYAMSPTGNKTGIGKSTGGNLQAPGVVVGIRGIGNTTKTEYQAWVKKNTDDVTDEVATVVTDNGNIGYEMWSRYHKHAPESVAYNTRIKERYALIARPNSGGFDFPGRKNIYAYGSGLYTGNLQNVYEVNRTSGYEAYEPAIVDSLMSAKYIAKWEDGSFDWDDLVDVYSDTVSKRANAQKTFIASMADTGKISDLFADANTDSLRDQAEFFDLMCTVNRMCDNAYSDFLKNYLLNRNTDRSETFYFIEVISVAGIKCTDGDIAWYSYPTYMSNMTNKSTATFMDYTEAKHNGDYYGNNRDGFANIDKAWEASLGYKVTSKYLGNCKNYVWYDTWIARYNLMTRDKSNHRTWGSGYTFIADYGPVTTFDKATGRMKITANPKNTKVDNGETTQAEIELSLLTDPEFIEDDKEIFTKLLKKSVKPVMTIKLTFESVSGSGTSTDPYDELLNTDGWTMSATNVITRTFSKWADLEPYLKGTKTLKLIDKDVKITENTENRYKAAVTLDWNAPKDEDDAKAVFVSKGTEKASKGKTIATDLASWYVDLMAAAPEEATYYSQAETPYVEIKEGSPENETYEAMAGVPTTENLYVGFGASEFKINMEATSKDAPVSNRTYTLTYTSTQCIEVDEKCKITCPGHTTATHVVTPAVPPDKDGKGGSPAVYCTAGYAGAGQTATCSCGKSTVTCPNNGKSMCTWNDGAEGCVHNQEINQAHPHTHVWTGTVTQPIDKFKYLDIKGLELWELNRCVLEGNAELFSNPLQTINPNTGYRAFYDQEGYASGNGRLIFSFNYNTSDKYGNTTTAQSDGTKQKKTACDTAATAWMNSKIAGVTTNAKVVSDFVSLTTTEGYQVPSYHEYLSDTVPIATGSFSTGSESKSVSGPNITFGNKPTHADLWTNNANSAANWEPDRITRSGYNGNFASPSTKWDNTNLVQFSDPSAYLGTHPNTKIKTGSNSFATGVNNQRLTYKGLDIIDSTDVSRNWSASDSLLPVLNSWYDTGTCRIEADKEIEFNDTDGDDYATDGTMHKEDATYSSAHDKVNDIVVHNPVSAQYATIITNEEKYDLRTTESLADGGDPISQEHASCPRDSSCQFSKLTCTTAPTQHTAACYASVASDAVHVGGMNAHVHVPACYAPVGSGITTSSFSESQAHLSTNGSTMTITPGALNESFQTTGVLTSGKLYEISLTASSTYAGEHLYVDAYPDSLPESMFTLTTTPEVYTFEFTSSQSAMNGAVARVFASGSATIGTITVTGVQVREVICTNTPNVHVCTTACTATTKSVLVCDDPHHYAAGEPWDYNDSNNHYDFGDSRCYSPCGDGDIDMSQFSVSGVRASIAETTNGLAIKLAAGANSNSYAEATNIFSKDSTMIVAFDALSTVDGDKVKVQAGATGLPQEEFVLTTVKKSYVFTATSSSADMQNAVLRFVQASGGNAGDIVISNIVAGECAQSGSHTHTAACIVSKHKNAGSIVLPDGTVQSSSGIFVNLDREFKVYYPDMGDFAQSPGLHGIASCTSIRGMGYTDGMNTAKWLREKYVTLPVNVIDANGKSHYAGDIIDLLKLPEVNGYYTFYCVLANHEAANAGVRYLSVGNNAPEQEAYNDTEDTTNRERSGDLSSPHSGTKYQLFDVLGYIGSLTLNDTGDFRFATLFKKLANNNQWLIANLVPAVNYKLPNKILSDELDVRQEVAMDGTKWHSAYQVTEALTGGKAYQHVSLPLTPAKNLIPALQKQPLRPGYQLFMDIETVGNYYGENYDINSTPVDTNLYYKMQVTPRYWELDLNTGSYTPVDVYMGVNGEYEPVVLFGNSTDSSEWLYYLDWLEESARRNYTAKEKTASNSVASDYSLVIGNQTTPEGTTIPGYTQRVRLPLTQADPIGTANRLFLNDLDRTFIGSSTTYGANKNPDNYWFESYFARQSQRWNYSLGLPSSSVFVTAGQPCTKVNIDTLQSHSSVIVCAINVKVKGEIWTLEYNGAGINNSDGGGFKVTPTGSTFAPPIDPDTGEPLTDPIIAVYSNKFTSKDDLRTEGTH